MIEVCGREASALGAPGCDRSRRTFDFALLILGLTRPGEVLGFVVSTPLA